MGILRVGLDRLLQIALRRAVMSGAIGGLAGTGEGHGVTTIQAKDLLVFEKSIAVILGLGEKLRGLKMKLWIGWQGCGKGYQFRLSLRACAFLQKEFDQLHASFAPISIGIGAPDTVHGIVVVADRVVHGAATGGHPAESKIDGAVLGSALPQGKQVRLRLVETTSVAQGASEAELILGIRRIAGQRGAEFLYGVIEFARADVGQTLDVELASACLLVGIVSVDQVADSGEGDNGRERENQQNCRRGARDELGERPRHISSHDIIPESLRGRYASGLPRNNSGTLQFALVSTRLWGLVEINFKGVVYAELVSGIGPGGLLRYARIRICECA